MEDVYLTVLEQASRIDHFRRSFQYFKSIRVSRLRVESAIKNVPPQFDNKTENQNKSRNLYGMWIFRKITKS